MPSETYLYIINEKILLRLERIWRYSEKLGIQRQTGFGRHNSSQELHNGKLYDHRRTPIPCRQMFRVSGPRSDPGEQPHSSQSKAAPK